MLREMLNVLENTSPTWLGLSLPSSSSTIGVSEAIERGSRPGAEKQRLDQALNTG